MLWEYVTEWFLGFFCRVLFSYLQDSQLVFSLICADEQRTIAGDEEHPRGESPSAPFAERTPQLPPWPEPLLKPLPELESPFASRADEPRGGQNEDTTPFSLSLSILLSVALSFACSFPPPFSLPLSPFALLSASHAARMRAGMVASQHLVLIADDG